MYLRLGDYTQEFDEYRIYPGYFNYFQGGCIIPAYCFPGDTPRWWIKYQYNKRGWLYVIKDERLLSALIGELVNQGILDADKFFHILSDKVYVFVDYKTRRCRYLLPNILRDNGLNDTKQYVYTAHAFGFDQYRTEYHYDDNRLHGPTYVASVEHVKTKAFRYTGTAVSRGQYMDANHFKKLLRILPVKEITFEDWAEKTTEGKINPVIAFNYVINNMRYMHEFL